MSRQEGTTRLADYASSFLRPILSQYECVLTHAQPRVVVTHVSSGELPAERMPIDMDPSTPDDHCGEQYCISAACATEVTWQRSGSR